MRFNLDGIIVAAGEHGPFVDKEHPDDRTKDRTYRWYDVAASDGSGLQKCTLAQSVDGVDAPFEFELFKPVRVALEIHGEARKVRLLGNAIQEARSARAA